MKHTKKFIAFRCTNYSQLIMYDIDFDSINIADVSVKLLGGAKNERGIER